jgi:hypothetical protein
MRRLCVSGCVLAILLGGACERRAARIDAPPELVPGFVDLRPGWRLRVVTPLLKSGGYTLTVAAGDELEGYETSYYSVAPHPKGGVRIAFASADVTKQGASAPQPRPVAPLFDLPAGARFVRLIFLTRVSPTDHDMAVVAAADPTALSRLTAEVQADSRACVSARRSYCSWIPLGIAVRPESRTGESGAGDWAPVR